MHDLRHEHTAIDPYLMEKSPFLGACLCRRRVRCKARSRRVLTTVDAYLTFQEYFEQHERRPEALGQAACGSAGRISSAQASLASRRSAERTPCPAPSSDIARSADAGFLRSRTRRRRDSLISPEFKAAGHPGLPVRRGMPRGRFSGLLRHPHDVGAGIRS